MTNSPNKQSRTHVALTPSAPELNPKDQVQLIASHRPGLRDGDYTIDVCQEVTISGKTRWFPRAGKEFQARFSVLGERFQLPPEQIHAAFPPPGSRGDFWRDLPHVILERSTLPWERTAVPGRPTQEDPPWLALIVFHGAEAPSPRESAKKEPLGRGTVALNSLLSAVKGPDYHWPGVRKQYGQHRTDRVTVIDVPKPLLEAQLPSFDYQTHCRGRLAYLGTEQMSAGSIQKTLREVLGNQRPEATLSPDAVVVPLPDKKWRVRDHAAGQEYEIWQTVAGSFDFYRVATENAIVLGRRLPLPGARNVVHLVSLEARYDGTDFNFQGADNDGLIRLVSLYNWEFSCEDPHKDFIGLLENVNKDQHGAETPSTFRLPVPERASAETEDVLRAGFVPLVHRFRQGSRSVSWYHGPLMPRELEGQGTKANARQVSPGPVTPRASVADELVIFDAERGLFDVSYAAAWELGRMLMLRNTRVATALYHWKRDHAHSLHSARDLAEYGFELPVHTHGAAEPPGLPADVIQWLNDLALLRHVPFPYLVPDERLLPAESLRFFTLDRAWLECLRDGAFSIGRVSTADVERDHDERPPAASQTIPAISGFVLRSEAVSGFWPSLRVKAYAEAVPVNGARGEKDRRVSNLLDTSNKELSHAYPTLSIARMERLSKNVMICLCVDEQNGKYGDRVVKMADVQLKPEMLHFGFEESPSVPPHSNPASRGAPREFLFKQPRDAAGNQSKHRVALGKDESGEVVVRDDRVVDMTELARRLNGRDSATPAEFAARFALNMIAGTDMERFCRR